VITDDEVMRLFERADPARVDRVSLRIDAAGYLDALRTRSSNVTIIETTPPPTRRQWPIITAAVAATVLIVVGALVLAMREDTTEPVIDTPVTTEAPVIPSIVTPEQTAASFLVAAFDAFNAEQAITYLADDADISELINSAWAEGVHESEEGLRLYISLLHAEGYEMSLYRPCYEDSSAFGTRLICTVRFGNLGSHELGLGPFNGSYFDLTVRDGKIVRASQIFLAEKFAAQMWEPFANWVSKTYPEDAAVMYQDGSRSVERLSEESIRLWGQHTRDYVQEMKRLAETQTTP
jgi:hypothetical protein